MPAEYSGFDELGVQHRCGDRRPGTPIGDGNPVAEGQARPPGDRVRDRQQDAGRQGARRLRPGRDARSSRRSTRTPHYDPGNGHQHVRPGQGQPDARRRRLHQGLRRHPGRPGQRQAAELPALRPRRQPDARSDSCSTSRAGCKDVGIETNVQIVSEDKLTEIIGNGEYDLFEWGWVVEPDPDYQLSTFLCASRSTKDGGTISAGLSDSFYCNPAYDDAVPAAGHDDRPRRRAPTSSSRCRRCSTTTRRTTSLYYYDNLEAYRSDRFTNFKPQPDPGRARCSSSTARTATATSSR